MSQDVVDGPVLARSAKEARSAGEPRSAGEVRSAGEARSAADVPPVETIAQITRLGDYITPIALRVVCDLAIPDLLADGPRDAADLAAKTGTHADSLHRVLRALAGQGLFFEDRQGRFALTEMSQLLRSDHPYTVRRMFQLIRPELDAWVNFDHAVRTGEDTFAHMHGESYWSRMEHDAKFREQFEAEIWCMTEHELRAVLPAYRWGDFGKLVDLGGGTGQMLAGILRANPDLRAVLFDLPHVAPHALPLLQRSGVADRCEIVSGDFFVSVPEGGDLYLLKRVFYDFDDAQTVAILRNVRAAMHADSRVVTLDGLARSDNRYDVGKLHDLFVLGLGRGRCRTRPEMVRMFAEAGLRLRRVIPTGVFPLVEAEPV
jgi:O-methyltransferase domain